MRADKHPNTFFYIYNTLA